MLKGTVAIGNPERHVCKAPHRGSKQQSRSCIAISLTIACSHHAYIFFILRTHPVHVESHNQRNATGEVATTSPPFYNEPHRSHVLYVKAEFGPTSTSWSQHHFVEVSRSVTHKHELWIWFTLSYAMMKALLRLVAVWDTNQTDDLRGYTVQFIASRSALVSMTQNGNIYWPIAQTATCPLARYKNKHIAENSQWVSQTTTCSWNYWRKESK